jgi:lipase chaperone LimK
VRAAWALVAVAACTDPAPPRAAPPPPPRAVAAPRPPARALPPPPSSLRGTDVDGDLERDAAGRFVATPAARLLFDYFLSAAGEEPAATIRARVAAEARRRLPAAEADAAMDLYDHYVSVRSRGEDFTF